MPLHAGKAGEKAAAQSDEAMAANLAAKAERAAAEAEARAKSTLSNAHLENGGVHGSVWGSEGAADAELDADKVKAALQKLEREEREAEAAAGDERKRKVGWLLLMEGGARSVGARCCEVCICSRSLPLLLSACHTLCWRLAAAPAR